MSETGKAGALSRWEDEGGALPCGPQEALAAEGVDRARIKAIGVSGQQHGMVVLDDAGEVLHPAKLWCDVEPEEEARALSEEQ